MGAEKLVCDSNVRTGGDVQPGESANKRLILCDEFGRGWFAVHRNAIDNEARAIWVRRRIAVDEVVAV